MIGPTHIWHPYTKRSLVDAGTLPVFTRGEGLYLYDDAGDAYLDAVSSWWCVALGHGRPEVVQAIQEQAATLAHCILGNQAHPPAIALAERLAGLMPSPDRKVFFASDGSCANEAALKIAVQYFHATGQPQRNRFLSLTTPYHGDTLGAVSVGFMEDFHAPFRPLAFPVTQLEPPPVPEGHDVLTAPLAEGSLDALDTILAEQGDQIAGVIVESLCQGAAGMRMIPAAWTRAVADRCQAAGVLVIVDEIAMGLGRTGKRFGFEHAGIDPDIVTLGKALTNGATPLSAAIVRESIYDAFTDSADADNTFYHGHTFTGHAIGCAAALATLDVFAKENIVDQARAGGEALQRAVQEKLAGHPAIEAAWGVGLIGAFRLKPYGPSALEVKAAMQARGILIRPLGRMAYFMPPLVTPEPVLVELVDQLVAVLDALGSSDDPG